MSDTEPIRTDELEGVLTFLRAAERLKTVTRSGWTSAGEQESVAEHTWRLCLMAMLLYGNTPGIDLARLLKMCLIHDLGEAIRGDVPAPAQTAGGNKAEQERTDLLELTASLPPPLQHEILELWDEYERADSPEARLAKGLDKLETILQHNQGNNQPTSTTPIIWTTASASPRRIRSWPPFGHDWTRRPPAGPRVIEGDDPI